MNEEVKIAWIDALKSGKYHRIAGSLKRDIHPPPAMTPVIGHCALGVLCDLAEQAGVIRSIRGEYGEWGYTTHPRERRFRDNTHPNDEILHWAGLEDSDLTLVNEQGARHSIIDYNDDEFCHVEWDELADMIKQQW